MSSLRHFNFDNQTVALMALTLIAILIAIGFALFISIYKSLARQKQKQNQKPISTSIEIQKDSFKDRLKKGLSRSQNEVWGKLTSLFLGNSLDKDFLEQLEEILYTADIGPETVEKLVKELQNISNKSDLSENDFKQYLYNFLKNIMAPVQENLDSSIFKFDKNNTKTITVMIVGVNGAGKTTTIGKIATQLTRQGAKVIVGACDTFRAAAVDQLQIWCDRANAKMIRAKEGTNPTGVAYDTLAQSISEKANYCLLDTAGRLHTKGNLMEELAKTKKVLQKLDPAAPHQILLVLDAITGQNAIKQAIEFNNYLGITGLIFTKCDSSSKAGSAISIVDKLKVPITYIGVGESVEDLDIFNLDDYLSALLAIDSRRQD